MRTCSGAASAFLIMFGFWMMPEPVSVAHVPMAVRISGIVLPLLIFLAGLMVFTWNALRENNL